MAKRKAVGFLISGMGLSERRACRIVGLSRSVQQYRPLPKDDEAAIKRMKELASENRRYGYLRLHAMLRREGLVVNHKRTYRLYTELGLQVRARRGGASCQDVTVSRLKRLNGQCSGGPWTLSATNWPTAAGSVPVKS